MRDWILGIILGLVVAVIGLAVLSVATGPGPTPPQHAAQQPPAPQPSTPQPSNPQPSTPQPSTPAPATQAAPPEPATPQAGAAPRAPEQSPEPPPGSPAPAAQTPPQAPQAEAPATGETGAALPQVGAPPQPAPAPEAGSGPSTAPAGTAAPTRTAEPAAPARQGAQAEAPASAGPPPTRLASPAKAPAGPAQAVPGAVPRGAPRVSPLPQIGASPAPAPAPQPEAPARPEAAPAAPPPSPAPAQAETRHTPGTRVVPLTERKSRVASLPAARQAKDRNVPAAEGQATRPAQPEEPRAILRNAAPFKNPEGQPTMAVVLIDEPAGRARLSSATQTGALPFAATFAVRAEQPDAAEAVHFYRARGDEVAIIVPLPPSARARDIEVTLEAHASLLDQAVAVIVPAETGFQTLGPAASQLARALKARGLGLVSLPRGLNTGHKSALKLGVPAGLVFREIDNDGQTSAAIRRVLDNAAFRARQEPGVILLGHLRPETISALIEWSLAKRAAGVRLAPLSYVLLAAQAGR